MDTKKIGLWSVILLTINSVIGSGIFLSPGSVVSKAGAKAPVVYLCAALFAAVLAITFAASAKYVRNGGAAYAYTKAAFGENAGLYIGITRFFSAAIAWGVMATGVVKTVLSIMHKDNSDFKLITIGFLVLMAVLFIINVLGTKVLEIVSNLSTIGKLLALVTVILAGIAIIVFTGTNNFSQLDTVTTAAAKNMSVSDFVVATIAAFYAFTGFESVASGSEDMEEPEKNLPKAIPLGILIVAIIYIGIVFVSMMINPVAITKTKEVVALVAVFDNPIIKNIVLYGSLISMFGINVAASFHTPRILESMARQGQVPQFFTKRTEKGLPITATVITVALAILMPIAFNYNMGQIMIISSIARFAQFLVVPLALMSFYYNKNKEATVTTAKKSFFTDVVCAALSLVLTLLLLVKFNWVEQFTNKDGSPKSLAIASMIIGFVVIPAITYFYNKGRKKA